MSPQVNFYISRNDEAKIIEKISSMAEVSFIKPISTTGSVVLFDNFGVAKEVPYFYFAMRRDLERIKFRHIPAQGYWIVDDDKSPVIEFSRSIWDGKNIRRGRIRYVKNYYDGGE